MKNGTSKATPPNTATDILAVAAKSEVIPTDLTRHNSMGSTKTQKTSYVKRILFSSSFKFSFSSKTDNDSEQEDSEVRKLTASMEHEKVQRQRTPSTHSSHQPILKKTMILSSDQLKRLNLKLGMNKVEFSVTTALQGTTTVESNIFFFDHMTKFVISDIDGTITR
jgi:phosphatidate phosphatase LPIN